MFQLEFGPCPASEDAVQLMRDVDNSQQMRLQCRFWLTQLERTLQQSRAYRDESVRLRVKSFEHDFGTYYEVVATCHDDDENAIAAAFWLDENAPTEFDSDLKAELTNLMKEQQNAI